MNQSEKLSGTERHRGAIAMTTLTAATAGQATSVFVPGPTP